MTAADIPSLMKRAIEQFVAGHAPAAEELFLQVIHEEPLNAGAHQFLGLLAYAAGRLPQAAAYMERSTELEPGNPGWYAQYGDVRQRMGEREKAGALYLKALELDPVNVQAAAGLAAMLVEQSLLAQAEAILKGPLEAFPEDPQLLSWTGIIASRRGDFAAAAACYERAVKEAPGDPKYLACLGNCYKDLGRLEEAKAAYAESLRIMPNVPMTRLNYAITLLLNGEFEPGWNEFEARPPAIAARRNNYQRPFWNGERVESLLLWAEQGFGDVIQFVRYAPVLMHAGVRVCLAVHPGLVELLQVVAGKDNVFSATGPVPLCDAQQLLLSLPRIFKTNLQNIPRTVPYLRADEARRKHFGELMAGDAAKLKVGIAWSGRATHTNDMNRSLDPALFARLADVPGVSFYSVQIGARTRPPADFPLHDLTGHVSNFADTAGLVSQLDLVISVDTSVVHLAGALARPVWVLLPRIADWRWMMHRTDSPWYPTMRLYRQVAAGDWTLPFQQVKEDLIALARGA